MFKKILVGVDGSDYANKALKAAVRLAKAYDAELAVFHAIERLPARLPLPVAQAVPVGARVMFVDSKLYSTRDVMLDAGRQVIDQARKIVIAIDSRYDTRVKFDLVNAPSPVEYAVKYAKMNVVDLIVVGCHGHHATRREYLGSIAARLLNDAPCAVLVVR